ncbi:MAG: nitroreductase family protein [Candidatus Gastranaerophilales bacterium]
MDAIELLKNRRSVRKYKNEKVDRQTMEEIIDVARFAPSWANFQVARYTLVENDEIIAKIADSGMSNFAYNINTLRGAKGVAVLSYVKGKSGTLGDSGYATNKANSWEVFDAGIACQTFCLAAFAKGVGTCIFGIFDDAALSKIINLPEDETVAAVIVYGYTEGTPAVASRKEVAEIARFID